MALKLAQCGRAAYRRFGSRVLYAPMLRPDSTVAAPFAAARHNAPPAALGQLFSLSNSYATAAGKSETKPKKTASKKTASKKLTSESMEDKKTTKKPTETKKAAAAKEKARIAELKSAALIGEDGAPLKRLPTTAFTVYARGKKGTLTEHMETFKQLSETELQGYQQTAEENAASNKQAWAQWLEDTPPLVIKEANDARHKLRTLFPKKTKHYKDIADDRLVKGPRSAYILYVSDKHRHGSEHDHLSAPERMKTVARAWKSESEDVKAKYTLLQQEDKLRYMREYKERYQTDSKMETDLKAKLHKAE